MDLNENQNERWNIHTYLLGRDTLPIQTWNPQQDKTLLSAIFSTIFHEWWHDAYISLVKCLYRDSKNICSHFTFQLSEEKPPQPRLHLHVFIFRMFYKAKCMTHSCPIYGENVEQYLLNGNRRDSFRSCLRLCCNFDVCLRMNISLVTPQQKSKRDNIS